MEFDRKELLERPHGKAQFTVGGLRPGHSCPPGPMWHVLGAQDLAADAENQAWNVPLMESTTLESSPEVPRGQKCDSNEIQL